jgi:hypothetical protein
MPCHSAEMGYLLADVFAQQPLTALFLKALLPRKIDYSTKGITVNSSQPQTIYNVCT